MVYLSNEDKSEEYLPPEMSDWLKLEALWWHQHIGWS